MKSSLNGKEPTELAVNEEQKAVLSYLLTKLQTLTKATQEAKAEYEGYVVNVAKVLEIKGEAQFDAGKMAFVIKPSLRALIGEGERHA